MARQIESTNAYKDVLLKLIPSEIVAAYMVIEGLTGKESYSKWVATLSASVLLFLIPFYLVKLYKMRRRLQVIFTMGSFVVWVYWMGGPFKYWGVHYAPIASIILVLWTLLVPLIFLPSKFNEGDEITISSTRQQDVARPLGGVVWRPEMDRYLGKKTRITEVDKKGRTVKLETDNGANQWAFEWLTPMSGGKENS